MSIGKTVSLPLKIGSVNFNQGPFEGPDGDKEGLGDLGVVQKAVVREFPGGIILAQLYGDFLKPVKWSGQLIGAKARSRAQELTRLAKTKEQVTFSWAEWSYEGFVQEFTVHAKGPFLLTYEILYRPLFDNNDAGGNQPANNDPFVTTVANAQKTMQQQADTPASGVTLQGGISSDVTDLNTSVSQALQQTGGSVAAVSTPTVTALQGQIFNLQNKLAPLIAGSDAQISSAAADLSGTLGILQTAFGNSQEQLLTTMSAANPNLYELALRFYGDETLYQIIQDANGLSDPLPETDGPITLKIPILPALTPISNATVLNGKAA